MVDDLHHLVRMHRHDDLRWSFDSDDAIVLRPYDSEHGAGERIDELCQKLGFEALGLGRWRVVPSSPHYEDLWVYVEQDRLDGLA